MKNENLKNEKNIQLYPGSNFKISTKIFPAHRSEIFQTHTKLKEFSSTLTKLNKIKKEIKTVETRSNLPYQIIAKTPFRIPQVYHVNMCIHA